MSISLLIGIWWHLPPYRLSTDRKVVALGPEGRDGALGLVGRPERSPTVGASSSQCGEIQGLIGLRAGTPSGHEGTP